MKLAGLILVLLLLLSTFASPALAQTSLTLNERIQAQERIERVYYNHRIWPESNNRPKPPFEQMIPRSVIEQKVIDSLKKSAALQDFWKRPISSEMLQAEMDRMAKTTHDPSMVKELFSALNNDPFLIAEILTRPIVAGRMIQDNNRTNTVSNSSQKMFRLPAINSGASCEGWEVLNASNPPSARSGHTAVWTGTEMIIWGGGASGLNTGGRYDPALNTWTPTSTGTNVPSARFGHTAIWTGSEMIIWGGADSVSDLNTGGRYNPVSDTWTPTSVGANVPDGRPYHTAVWTGTHMIVWGGGEEYSQTNTGGRYDPSTDTWQATSTGLDVPSPRVFHSAVWSGQEMIIWGGLEGEYATSSGGRYNPVSDTWLPTSFNNAPDFRFHHTAIWTGNEMIIWGGRYYEYYRSATNTGARYDPAADTWLATPTSGAPHYRNQHTAVWTGNEMIIWSGNFFDWNTKTGGRYNLLGDNWTGTAVGPNAPSERSEHTAIWTGSKMIVWGGNDMGSDLDTGGIYTPNTDNIALSPVALPNAEIGTPYLQTISASGGAPPYSMTITEGWLGHGLTFDGSTGVISGTPIESKDLFPIFAVTATDASSCAGSQGYYFFICPVITFSPPTLPDGEVGIAYNQTITPSGGLAPYLFSITVGALPAGLTLDSTVSTATISGVPTTVETANFTITATDVITCAKSKDYTINIMPACLLCDDFEDGVEDPNWTEVKVAWNEAGGFLVGVPTRNKAIIIASPIFNGCQNCSEETTMMTAGGLGNKVSMLGWYVDKNNLMELQLKEEADKIVLKQKVNGSIVAKAKANFAIAPNTAYIVKVSFDGTVFTVSVNGSPLLTLVPAAPVPIGTIGFQVKRTTGSFGYITVN